MFITTPCVSPLYIFIHACVGLKHYDIFFKYPNPLFYNELQSMFVFYTFTILFYLYLASTNFLSCMHTPAPHPPSASPLLCTFVSL